MRCNRRSKHSSGEWLVFTDADVHFAPDLLAALRLPWRDKALGPRDAARRAEMFTVGEKIAMTFFAMAFVLGTRPWAASDPGSRMYAGVGAFQMIRRSAYEKMGTHRRLAMEVVDDMKLGKLVKEAGFRSGVAEGRRSGERSLACGAAQHHSRHDEEFLRDHRDFRLWLTCVHILRACC